MASSVPARASETCAASVSSTSVATESDLDFFASGPAESESVLADRFSELEGPSGLFARGVNDIRTNSNLGADVIERRIDLPRLGTERRNSGSLRLHSLKHSNKKATSILKVRVYPHAKFCSLISPLSFALVDPHYTKK